MATLFPRKLIVGDCTLILNADGTFEGDGDAFVKAVGAMDNSIIAPGARDKIALLWCVAAHVRAQRKGFPDRE